MTVSISPFKLADQWGDLGELCARAQAAENEQSLLFVIANDTFALVPYRSALVFTIHNGEAVLGCASGLSSIDRHSAFCSWAEQAVKCISPRLSQTNLFTVQDLPEDLRDPWREYWPRQVQMYPIPGNSGELLGAVIYVSDDPWPEDASPMLRVLHRMHGLCFQTLRARWRPLDVFRQLVDGRNLKTQRYVRRIFLVLILVLLLPIRQFVIAPAEIISLESIAVTVPVDGFIAEMVAKPNQQVQKGDTLFRLDDTAIRNRLETARQGLEVARAEYLAGAHRAFVSSDRTAEAGVLRGRINERLAEVSFLHDQLGMLEVRATRAGIAIYGQENDWVGKPVNSGQRIMELADPDKPGLNVWIPVADAINLRSGEEIYVLLHSDPLAPLKATTEQASYQAIRSPDGFPAYRLRATLPPHSRLRLGLRGNAKIDGDWVVLGYFLFRRPLTTIRQWLGV